MVQMYNIIDNAIRLDKTNLKIVIKKSINLQRI